MEGFLMLLLIGMLAVVVFALLMIYHKPHPPIPPSEEKILSQSIIVKADADITTVLPAPILSATCCHTWDVLVDRTLTAPHEQSSFVILKCHKCGILDKTKVITSKPPSPEWKKENCKHDWEEEKTVHLKSAFEQIADAGFAKGFDVKKINVDDLPRDFFRKVYIKVRICKVCGEVNKIEASNYDMEEVEEES